MTMHNQPFRSPERDELLAAVKSVAGLIDGAAQAAEEQRDLSAATVAAMGKAGLLKYASPRIVGGYEVDPISSAEISEAIARVDLCAAWLAVQQSTSASVFSRVVSDAAFETMFGESQLPILSGSISPLAGAFRAVDGGYLVNGRWSFLSAVRHAQWVTVAGTLADPGDGPTHPIGAVIPKSAIVFEDNWYVAGMLASGSYDISVKQLFVPADMTYAHKVPPTRKRDLEGRRGFPPHMNAVAMGLGAARRVIDEVIKQSLAKVRPGAKEAVAHRPYFQHFLGESEMRLRAARAGFHEIITEMWRLEREEDAFPFELTAQLTASPAFIFSLACDIATRALRFIGSNAARLDNPLQRFHRDLTVMSLHVQNGEQYYETFGQQLLGLDMIVPGGSNMIGTRARLETENRSSTVPA
jgi:alkylation response protein AidB-like acyl-CoA dehydrogenase